MEIEKAIIRYEVIAEVVYVLRGVYKVSRKEISQIIIDLLKPANICVKDKDTLRMALDYYSTKKLDFVDLILLAYAQNHHRKVFTFDKKLKKEIEDIEKKKEDE